MEIDDLNIKMLRSEVGKWCPLDPKFAAAQIRRYGVPLVSGSKTMAAYASCPEILELAGYSVEIVEDVPDAADGAEVTPGNIPEPPEPMETPRTLPEPEKPGV